MKKKKKGETQNACMAVEKSAIIKNKQKIKIRIEKTKYGKQAKRLGRCWTANYNDLQGNVLTFYTIDTFMINKKKNHILYQK